MSKKEVPVQKGPINPSEPTRKTMMRSETEREDTMNGHLKRSGQILKMDTPKK